MILQFEPVITARDIAAVCSQMQSGFVGPGKTTEEFEKKLAEIANRRYCFATTSGTTALMLSILALEIPKGKTILFPSYTFLAGANAAKLLGYNVQLIDINPETLCIDVKKLEEWLWLDSTAVPMIGAVMFVNHNGYVRSDVYAVKSLCRAYEVPMIEDAAQCMGIDGAFQVGDISTVSFSVPKLINCGQGGAVFTDNDNLAQKIDQIRDQGGSDWRKTRIHKHVGGNFRFNDILASYGLSQLNRLEEIKENKKRILDRYSKHIEIYRYDQNITWMAIYRTKNANRIIEELKANDIQGVRYYRPVCENDQFKSSEKFEVAEMLYEELVYLPSSLNLEDLQIDKVCEIIKETENG
jgi:perosamine synthetase